MSAPVIRLYVHHVAFDLVAAGSMLLVDDLSWRTSSPLLFTVTARSASSHGTGSITADVILSSGRYERFTLTRYSDVSWSLPCELSARLVLQ